MNYKKEKALKLCAHMLDGGKVVVKDKHDNTIKESEIFCVECDYNVILRNTIWPEYSVMDVTIIPIEK